MQLKRLLFILSFWLCHHGVFAAEYLYRDLPGDTFSASKCTDNPMAPQIAMKPYTRDQVAKKMCHTLGLGWHLDQIKNKGELTCPPCAIHPEQRCYMQKMLITCKLMQPDSRTALELELKRQRQKSAK